MVYARVPDAQVQTALDLMTDMVFAPAFTDLDSERDVVLEEIAMYEDTPQELVHDLFSQAVFGRHALGRPVIGTAEVISSVTKRVLSTYHRQMYAGGNVVIAAAGNVEHNKFIRMLAKAQSQQRPPAGGPRVRRPLVKAPPPGFRFAKKDTEQYHVCVGAPGIARSDPRRFAASILDSILGGSASSRLFQEIREKRGMAYSVYSFASQYTDTGLVGIYVGTREENLGPCVEIASEQLLDIAQGNVRPEEIARAKENLKGRIMLSMESTSNRMTRLGKSIITDTELLSFERIMAEIEAVEAEEVAELAEHLFAPEKLSISGIGPNERVFRAAARRINRPSSPAPHEAVLKAGAARSGGPGAGARASGARAVDLQEQSHGRLHRARSGRGQRGRRAGARDPCAIGTSSFDTPAWTRWHGTGG